MRMKVKEEIRKYSKLIKEEKEKNKEVEELITPEMRILLENKRRELSRKKNKSINIAEQELNEAKINYELACEKYKMKEGAVPTLGSRKSRCKVKLDDAKDLYELEVLRCNYHLEKYLNSYAENLLRLNSITHSFDVY
uniref:Uncharacterized protein n=1 Tax=Caenorhabditis tropicalis TaxID=1561998 RepID=A0A1I7U8S3_9PELO